MKQIKLFIKKAKSDSELMAKLDALGKSGAGTEEVAALAAEYGFTVTKEDMEAARLQICPRHGELSEEDLGAVSGGATQNRYNPNVCKPGFMYMPKGNGCDNGLFDMWCDHYRREFEGYFGDHNLEAYRHKCVMGAFNYLSNSNGTSWYGK